MYYRYYFGGDDDYCGLCLYLMMLLGQNDVDDENELRTTRLRYGVVVPLVDYDYVGYTYKNDPRMLYGKCIQFTGQQNYPLNIVGYLNKRLE